MIRFVAGVFTLLFAAILIFSAVGVTIVATFSDQSPTGDDHAPPPLVVLLVALGFVGATIALWTSALRRAEGDDLFSGDRGKLFAAMVMATLAVGVATVLFFLDLDAWRGFMDGSRG